MKYVKQGKVGLPEPLVQKAEEVLATNEVVFAVWSGGGRVILKGTALLRRVATFKRNITARVFFLPCADERQATALKALLGERNRWDEEGGK